MDSTCAARVTRVSGAVVIPEKPVAGPGWCPFVQVKPGTEP